MIRSITSDFTKREQSLIPFNPDDKIPEGAFRLSLIADEVFKFHEQWVADKDKSLMNLAIPYITHMKCTLKIDNNTFIHRYKTSKKFYGNLYPKSVLFFLNKSLNEHGTYFRSTASFSATIISKKWDNTRTTLINFEAFYDPQEGIVKTKKVFENVIFTLRDIKEIMQ